MLLQWDREDVFCLVLLVRKVHDHRLAVVGLSLCLYHSMQEGENGLKKKKKSRKWLEEEKGEKRGREISDCFS